MWQTFPGRRADKRIFLVVLVATQDRTVAVSGMLSGERALFFFIYIYIYLYINIYIYKYATWCRLSQQTIVPTLTVGLTFNVCRVSSVSSSSSRQSSAGATACSCLPRLAVLPRTHHGHIAP